MLGGFGYQRPMPRVRSVRLEMVPPVTGCLYAEVENSRLGPDSPFPRQRREPGPVGSLYGSVTRSEVHAGVSQKWGAEPWFETSYKSEQRVQRATRRVFIALVNGDCQETAIAPLASHCEGRAVRAPVTKVVVDRLE